MNNKTHLFTLTCCTLALTSCTQSEKVQKPNIIYILADDLGYGDLGCYGQQKIRTPHIDRMADQGMLFTQHYAGCTVSAPSRCSLMTGLHIGHAQIRGNKEIKPEGQQPMLAGTCTLGRLMQSAGYVTGLFGKWGLGSPESESIPTRMGFDTFFGYNCQRQAHSYYPEHLWSGEERIEYPENTNYGRKTYSQDIIHEQAKEFIRTNKDKPFYAMLTYTLPHAELNLPHDSLYHMYENSFDEVPYDIPVGQGYYPSAKPYASFAAMVSRLDMYVGEIMAELKSLGLDKNTLVIFTSDNGPHREGGANPDYFRSYGPLKGIKRDLFEGGIRVPMIAWYPGKVEAGVKNNHISAFWDVMPTLAELTASPLAVQSDGLSFLPALFSGNGQKQHDYLYWAFMEGTGSKAVRMGKWKGIVLNVREGGDDMMLFDLETDPGEQQNVADSHPGIVEVLYDKMQEAYEQPAIEDFAL